MQRGSEGLFTFAASSSMSSRTRVERDIITPSARPADGESLRAVDAAGANVLMCNRAHSHASRLEHNSHPSTCSRVTIASNAPGKM